MYVYTLMNIFMYPYVCMNVCVHVRTLMYVLPVPVTGHVLRHRNPEVLGRAVRVLCWDNYFREKYMNKC